MARHRIKKGLQLPIAGEPATPASVEGIERAKPPETVAVLAADFIGMKPTMHVGEGDTVKRGQLLFDDKKTPGVRFTAPAAGTIKGVNRGDRRALISVVIELTEGERAGDPPAAEVESFASYAAVEGKDPVGLERDDVQALLLESGLWTSLRARPFGRVADPASPPSSLFINLMDSNPLAAPPAVVLSSQANREALKVGVAALRTLSPSVTYVCKAPELEVGELQLDGLTGVRLEEFEGPHPAGTVGVHIHTLDPVGPGKHVWYINYPDVIAIGRLFQTGQLDVDRVVSLAGPQVSKPRLLRTRLGAEISAIAGGQCKDGDNRIISGSVLSGRQIGADANAAYLGRFHTQVSVIREDPERKLFGWMTPGIKTYSTLRGYLSAWMPGRYAMTSSTHGSHRAIVPIGQYERVMPMDILPTFLLRSLAVKDIERAEELGALELEEEDLALCTFVCPSKLDYGPMLRETLNIIEKEG